MSVTQVSPSVDAEDIGVNTVITATFNRDVDPETVTTSTFTVTGLDDLQIPGTVAYDSATKTATFTPTFMLKNWVNYTVTITTGVNATSSAETLNNLTQDYTWQFTAVSRPLVYYSYRALDKSDAKNDNDVDNIWTIDADGTNDGPLTTLKALGVSSMEPEWSPDGAKIAYYSSRAFDGSDAANNCYNIWVMNADGSYLTVLTSLTAGNAASYSPRWSPDGSRILFASQRALDGSDATNSNDNIWVMNADGSTNTPLTQLTIAGLYQSWMEP